MMKARKKGIANIDDRFNRMTRVFPSEEGEASEIYESVKELRLLFLSMSKGKPELSSYEFETNLLKSSYIKNKCQMKRVDLTIVFQKASYQ